MVIFMEKHPSDPPHILEADVVCKDKKKPERKHLSGLGRYRGAQTVRGASTKAAIIHLKCETFLTTKEIAEELQLHPGYVQKIWRQAVDEAAEASVDPEKRKELKSWLLNQLKLVIIKSQDLVEEQAAYGALVLKAVEQYATMSGIDTQEALSNKSTLEEIGKELTVRSPLVMSKLEGVKTLKDVERSTARLEREARKEGGE